jgi:N-acyl-D-aspartate/D-glutamate deacylase
MHVDRVIRNGLVVDGTGGEPFVADVAVLADKIVAVGPALTCTAAETVDATGLIVTPGFIDIHTHYDGQVTWDPLLSPSTQHGVTTICFGNCGIGFAPCRPSDREQLIKTLQSVEDIPEIALMEGVSWDWETFPEYMRVLRQSHTACDFMAMIGHVPLRLYTMGDRVLEAATEADCSRMRGLVTEALEAGAFGLSTSRTLLHRDPAGNAIPGTYASRQELTQLMAGMADAGGGFFEMIDDMADEDVEFDWIGRLSKAFRIPVSFAIATADPARRAKQLQCVRKANLEGACVSAQSSLKTQGVLQSLHSKYHPFIGHPTYEQQLAALPYADRLAAMRRPAMRAQLLAEESAFSDAPFWRTICHPANLYLLCPRGDGTPQYERDPATDSMAARAAKGVGIGLAAAVMGPAAADASPGEKPSPPAPSAPSAALGDGRAQAAAMALIYDALVFDEEVLFAPLGSPMQQANLDLLSDPLVKIGLGDGGAHLGIFQESACPTFMLAHYVRDRDPGTQGPRLPLQTAVKWQTRDTAEVVGLQVGSLPCYYTIIVTIIIVLIMFYCSSYSDCGRGRAAGPGAPVPGDARGHQRHRHGCAGTAPAVRSRGPARGEPGGEALASGIGSSCSHVCSPAARLHCCNCRGATVPGKFLEIPGSNCGGALTAAARRRLQDASGYRLTLCAGAVTFRDGAHTGALPGRLVPNPFRERRGEFGLARTAAGAAGAAGGEGEEGGGVGGGGADAVDPALLAGPEPRSTHDYMTPDGDVTGGASAIARAARARTAARTSSFGDFLSGKVLEGTAAAGGGGGAGAASPSGEALGGGKARL